MFKASPSEKSDAIINDVVRNNLFKNRDGIGGDLAARNIQRGRDHGLAPFRTYRESVCGLSGEPSWQYGDRKTNLILDHLYGEGQGYNKLEIFPGGLLERVETGEVGPTFSCLIRRQFEALRAGDRFFFTHSNTGGCHEFSMSQQQHIMKRSLRDIICDNTWSTGSWFNINIQPRVMEKENDSTNSASLCRNWGWGWGSTLDVRSLLESSEQCCGATPHPWR